MAQKKEALWQLPVTSHNGLFARCAPGTHEAVMALLADREVTPRPVLDLAAGTGALLSRLKDRGFTDLNAVELDIPAFGLPGVTPVAVDLNGAFASAFSRQFDLITAVEVIEHLDCPRHFLRELWKLLGPGGHLVVSTPNITHWMGRIWFLTKGEMRFFKERDYHHQRHISPISDTHMRLILREVGFDLVEVRSAGSFYGPLKRLVLALPAAIFRLLQGPLTSGDVLIYLARKAEPDDSSPGRNSDAYARRYHAAARQPSEPAPFR